MSMTCPFCRAEIPDDSWFCDQCGKELHFCPDCHKPKRGTQCAACGSDLVGAEEFFMGAGGSAVDMYLRAGDRKIKLREGIFGRTQGVYPEFAEDIYVSGRHGEFRINGGVWQVRDLGSTNGTFVGGRRLNKDEWVNLAPGMEIKIATGKYDISL